MTQAATTTATIALIAARVNVGDALDLDGQVRIVDEAQLVNGRIVWTFSDGTTDSRCALRIVEIMWS